MCQLYDAPSGVQSAAEPETTSEQNGSTEPGVCGGERGSMFALGNVQGNSEAPVHDTCCM